MAATYSPLPAQSIRLLKLVPARQTNTPLEAVLQETDLSLAIYEALSYTWGADTATEKLNLPDGNIMITRNLAIALRTLRYSNRPRTLWVDAVSINQENDREKCHQIALMGDIYRKATKVLIWLGEGSPEGDQAMKFLSDLSRKSKRYGLIEQDRHVLFHTAARFNTCPPALASELVRSALAAHVAVLGLRPWFKRSVRDS
jgi:hypothetical protein